MIRTILIMILGLTWAACDKNNAPAGKVYNYTFTGGTEGWTSFFSDYPVGDEANFELEFLKTNLPAPLDTNRPALKISGNNHSDDLLSMIVKKIDGLKPNTAYKLTFEVKLASNAALNAVGIGGSPDLALGAGAIPFDPANTPDSDNWYRPNFTSLLQSRMSNDTIIMLGTIGVDSEDFVLIERNNIASPLIATTNAQGELWLLIGTDSGYEGPTTLYYTSIKVTMN